MKKLRRSIFILLITCSVFYESCGTGINLFSRNDDAQLGKDLDAEIRNNPAEYPIFKGDPSIKRYINERIFQHILTSPRIGSKDVFNYQIEIIDQDILNAFALPGGYIYLYTGLLSYLDSEAALAGVIGHEIAHAEERHATQRLTSYYGVSILLSLILGENPSTIAEIGANLFVGLAFLANSRSDENESDLESFEYLRETRYYPGGVKFFFEKMRDDGLISSKSDKVSTFLSTHPDPIERISNTNSRLQNAGLPVKDYTSEGEGIFKIEYSINIRNKLP